MNAWQVVRALALKDLRAELRSRDVLGATVFFAGLVILILGFALGPDQGRLQAAAPGILWTAVAFASVLAAGRAFAVEQESGALESLTLYPVPHELLYLGKLAAHFVLLLVLAAVVTPLSLIIYDLSPGSRWPLLLLTVFLGVLGFAAVSCFYAAITVNLRAREALLPVLMFPVMVPVVLATVKSTALIVSGGLDSEITSWLGLLLVFDAVTLVVASLTFPYALEH
ncbi:heme exporter protein B [Deinobacterium chartae]|uniref:Heme exporter protein B n=1 Tax=Deinobacterium chartae TaxID=521158 RepID=A0A841I2A3_9DEIO|nr:heme exporter protein CcmB [Deinobacterium chartae]MBB6098182.1 heme exporter protein B [Deinobacterium chartae]